MVGLTGGIGAGKSVVATRLTALGAVVIDADALAREVVAPGTAGLAEVVAAFGPGILAADDSLDRPALGRIAFGDEAARHRLEAIVHPRVRARTQELARAAPPDAIVVNDVPLLAESGLAPSYHLVLVVHADEATRADRLVRLRGMTEAEAYERMHAQASEARRLAVADAVLENVASLDELNRHVDALWTNRLVPYEENVRRRRAVWPERAPVVPYDPTWPDQYGRLAARIARAAGPAVRSLGHIGPTAVPGHPAEDTVDIQLGVNDLDAADAIADALAAAGLPRACGATPERLHGNADPARPVNLHVRVAGSPAWRRALLVRDFLRAQAGHPQLAAAVAAPPEPELEHWARRTGWTP